MDRLYCSLGLGTSRPEPMEELCVQSCDRNTILYDIITMEILSSEGQSCCRSLKWCKRRTVENHGRLVACAFLANPTPTVLAPEHTRSRHFPS